MTVHRLLNEAAFDAETVQVIGTAFDYVMRHFRLADRQDSVTETIAKTIIEFAQQGERDPARLKELTLKALTGQNQGF